MTFSPDFSEAETAAAKTLIHLALEEDLGSIGDITASTVIPSEARGAATVVSRRKGVIAGLPALGLLAQELGLIEGWRPILNDGSPVDPGSVVAEIRGSMRLLLTFERTALNILQHLSGVASLTARFVAEVAETRAVILDTRKTLPGWRLLDKYAVRAGGGRNHRIGLYDAVLIKDNHLAWLSHQPDPIAKSIQSARIGVKPGTLVEVEVDTLVQFEAALKAQPDVILVDNLGPADLAEAVRRRNDSAPSIRLEASGGVDLSSVRRIAESGVDFISVGALTHSAPALDLGLDFSDIIAPN